MENLKLFDSELKLMELLWENEPASAKELSLLAAEAIGWSKNTTYTVIKKLVEKGAIGRSEPGFMCRTLIKREAVQRAETRSLINRLYAGSKKAFFASFLQNEALSEEEVAEIKAMLDKR